MSKSFKQFKKGDYGLIEAKASETHLQYLRAKTARNDHFEARRYIADTLANARKNRRRTARRRVLYYR